MNKNNIEEIINRYCSLFDKSCQTVFVLHSVEIQGHKDFIIIYVSQYFYINTKVPKERYVGSSFCKSFVNIGDDLKDLYWTIAKNGGYNSYKGLSMYDKQEVIQHVFRLCEDYIVVVVEPIDQIYNDINTSGLIVTIFNDKSDYDDNIIFVSRNVLHHLGYKDMNEFRSYPIDKIFLKKDLSSIFTKLKKLKNGESVSYLNKWFKKDGSALIYSSVICAIDNGMGKYSYLSVVMDISEFAYNIFAEKDELNNNIDNIESFFSFIVNVNISDMTYNTVYKHFNLLNGITDSGNLRNFTDEFVKYYVSEDNVKIVKNFLSESHIKRFNKSDNNHNSEKCLFRLRYNNIVRNVNLVILHSKSNDNVVTIAMQDWNDDISRVANADEDLLLKHLSLAQSKLIQLLLELNIYDLFFQYDVLNDIMMFARKTAEKGKYETIHFEEYSKNVRKQTFIHADDLELFISGLRHMIVIANNTAIPSADDMVDIRAKVDTSYYQWYRVEFVDEVNESTNKVEFVFGRVKNIEEERRQKMECEHDTFTKLYNRESYINNINEFLRDNNDIGDCALLMIDIDNLKIINDTLGHICGDNVIKVLSEVLSGEFSQDGYVARLGGGDEFSVFIKHCTKEMLIKRLNVVMLDLKRKNISNVLHGFSVSAGIVFNEDIYANTFSRLYKMADDALYKAKLSGKSHAFVYKQADKKEDKNDKISFWNKLIDHFHIGSALKHPSFSFFVILVMVVIMIFLTFSLVSIYSSKKKIYDMYQTSSKYFAGAKVIHEAGINAYMLRDNIKRFVHTGEQIYAENYFDAITIRRSNEITINMLNKLDVDQKYIDETKNTQILIDSLRQMEYHAIKLVYLAKNYPLDKCPSQIRKFSLSPEEINLSSDDKMKIAVNIVYSSQYDFQETRIYSTIEQIEYEMMYESSTLFDQSIYYMDNTIFKKGLWLDIIIAFLFCLVIVPFIYVNRYIRNYNNSIRASKEIQPAGFIEMYDLGISLNHYMRYNKDKILFYTRMKDDQDIYVTNLYHKMIETIMSFESVDDTGQYHSTRIRKICEIIIEQLINEYPELDLEKKDIELISWASLLHDIGREKNDNRLYYNISEFSDEDEAVIKLRVANAQTLIERMNVLKMTDYYHYIYDICKFHYERSDGNGLPYHIADEHIPIAAKIVSAAEVYENIYSNIPDKKNFQLIYQEMTSGKYGVFSSRILECISSSFDNINNALA